MTDLDLSWLAGFFDGEGNVGLYPGFRVVISQSDRRVLDSIRDLVGYGRVVSNSHPPRDEYARKPAFQWRCCGPDARRFAAMIRPHVRLKAPQIDEALRKDLLSVRPRRARSESNARLAL